MGEFAWQERIEPGQITVWRCDTKQCVIELWPRPSYCDRGRWQAYVLCPGYPANPNPFDAHDGFPRYYFDLDRAKAEMEDMLKFRRYEPVGSRAALGEADG